MFTRKPYKGAVTSQEVIGAYTKAFRVPWWKMLLPGVFGVDFKLADQTYQEVDYDKIAEIIAIDQTEQEVYSVDEDGSPIEDFDCDDFAFSLMGAFHKDRETAAMPIFITWVQTEMGGHALVSFYDGGAVVMIEPQNDGMFGVPEGWKLMLVCG